MPQSIDTARFILKTGERQVARNEILQAIEKFDEKKRGKVPDTQRGWFVQENEQRYPPKWLLRLATGLLLSEFSGREARETLRALGFELRSVNDAPMAPVEKGDEEEEPEENNGRIFDLERNLQRVLRANIDQLESGLKIADNNKEQRVEYGDMAEPGCIDITAEDKDGVTVAIELKAGKAGRHAIGQISGYMGALFPIKKPIRGILVAGEFSAQAIAAARVVNGLQLRKYNYKFGFEIAGAVR